VDAIGQRISQLLRHTTYPVLISVSSVLASSDWTSAVKRNYVLLSKKTLLYTYICSSNTYVRRLKMREPKLGKLELQIMETLWTRGQASIREIQEAFPERARPAYTTIQTTVYRLEGKKAVRRVRKLGNFHIFEAAVSRSAAQRKLIDDLLTLFGGRTQPVMAHLIESGKLTLEDVKEAEKTLRRLEGKDKSV
jgi:BlaI family transcriptional regulator, penicillinase repressor